MNWPLVGSMLLPNVGGWVSSLTMIGQVKSRSGSAWYETINRPRWNPPNWVFCPAWTILYSGMGAAVYMVYNDCGGFTENAALPLTLYGAQLILNWTWTPVFFSYHKIGLALSNMLVLDIAATACTASFAVINQHTLYLMVPYLCWLGFATALNHSIWMLNKDEVKVEEITEENDDKMEKL